MFNNCLGELYMLSRFEINKDTKKGGQSMYSPHVHSYCELFYLLKGHCDFLLADKTFSLIEGTIVLIPPNILHKTTYTHNELCERINIEFTYDYVSNLDKCFGNLWINTNSFSNFIYIKPEYREPINDQLDNLINETHIKDIFSDYLIKINFESLVLQLIRIREEPSVFTINNNTIIVDKSIKKALQYIDNYYYENITLTQIADILGLNPSYFSNKFKTINGIGFKEYLNMIRIRHAEQLLIETNLDITSIALQCGFESSNYFGDSFKKIHHTSPTQFRKLKGNIK